MKKNRNNKLDIYVFVSTCVTKKLIQLTKFQGKKLEKKTMSYNEENQLGAKNEANFDAFQNI